MQKGEQNNFFMYYNRKDRQLFSGVHKRYIYEREHFKKIEAITYHHDFHYPLFV